MTTNRTGAFNPLDVKVLYTEGCAATPATIQLVHDVALRMEIPITLRQVSVDSLEDALALKFLGSPTVQIGGLDVDPTGRANTAYGFM